VSATAPRESGAGFSSVWHPRDQRAWMRFVTALRVAVVVLLVVSVLLAAV
jgi:hypothetical protein